MCCSSPSTKTSSSITSGMFSARNALARARAAAHGHNCANAWPRGVGVGRSGPGPVTGQDDRRRDSQEKVILKSTVRPPPPCTPRRAASAQAIAGHTFKLQQAGYKIRGPERQGPPALQRLGRHLLQGQRCSLLRRLGARQQALGLLLVSGAQKQHVSSSCRGSKNNRLAGRVAYVWVRLPAATF